MKKKTGLMFFPAFDWAISPTHPEREERLLYTRDQIFEEGVMDLPEIKEYAPRLATLHDIARVHFCVPRVQSQVTEAHLIAAGSALQLGDAVVTGEIKNAFAMVRPPGHHAMRVVHGNRGFCNINNEAVLVDYLRRRYGLKRIAIIDSDVHHGDGTQDIFYHDPDVLFISFHQDGRTIFPGSGFTHELGGPQAYGTTLNVPMPPEMSDDCMDYIAGNLILPVLEDFQPDLVINSAGQDNHYSDPLGDMNFSTRGYADFTRKLKPDMAVLEGGYAIESALPYLNLAITLALAGLDYSNVVEPGYRPGRFSENNDRSAHVQRTVHYLRDVWEKRHNADVDKIFGKGDFYERKKSIYYDTDYIEEQQLESVKKCSNCPGYMIIQSSGERGFRAPLRAYAISVPFPACGKCQSEAYEAYHAAKKEQQYDYVILQDKSLDTCYNYDRESNQEWHTEG